MKPNLTIVGNLTADPELGFTASGKAIASLNVAVSDRVKDTDGTWKDGDPTYWRVTVWDRLGENVADSLAKGQRVIVTGPVSSRSWETKEGEKRVTFEITADAVGPDLKWDKATVQRSSKGSSRGQEPADDPWASGAVGLDQLAEAPF